MSVTYEPGQHYNYQLLIKHILEMPLVFAPNQEIVYRDKLRLTYRQLNERIHRLAGGLEKLGVKKGDVVCVFDYDSNRYLECFFAVPMMGAVLHTQNWRLSPDQILYTMNHAEDSRHHPCGLPAASEAVWAQSNGQTGFLILEATVGRPRRSPLR
jgi:fatty-acyl-CoA synthase